MATLICAALPKKHGIMNLYFNENNNFPAQWLQNYFRGATIDERSITKVDPDKLTGFRRVHLFAGIGGWELALQEAGWKEDVPVWTGSCPCQPFSTAGKKKGTADDRHLWPEFFRLIASCRPPHIFGEQVSGRQVTGKLYTERAFERLEPEARREAEEADAEAWLNNVQTDLEGLGYIVGSVSFPACSVGAPHARQRLYLYARLLADPSCKRLEGRQEQSAWKKCSPPERDGCVSCRMADNQTHRQGAFNWQPGESIRPEKPAGGSGIFGRMADMHQDGCGETGGNIPTPRGNGIERDSTVDDHGPTNGHWRDADWIYCRDNKWRPVEPGSSPLADGVSIKSPGGRAKLARMARMARKGQLSGYGNAIVIPQAVEFIKAVMEEINVY